MGTIKFDRICNAGKLTRRISSSFAPITTVDGNNKLFFVVNDFSNKNKEVSGKQLSHVATTTNNCEIVGYGKECYLKIPFEKQHIYYSVNEVKIQ